MKGAFTIAAIFLGIILIACGQCRAEDLSDVSLHISQQEAEKDVHYCALFVADKITDIYYKPWMLSEVALTLVEVGEQGKVGGILDKAAAIAMGLNNPSYRADALLEVASGYAEIEQHNKALSIADTIEAVIPRIKTFCAIATKYNEDGFHDKSIDVLARALGSLNEAPGNTRDNALVALSSAYAAVGEYDEGLRVSQGIEAPYPRVTAFLGIAEEYIRSRQKAEALKVLGRTRVTAGLIQDSIETPTALAEIAKQYAEVKEADHAVAILDGALKVTTEIKSKYSKPDILSKISDGYLKAGLYEKALEVAESIEDDNYKPRAMAKAAVGYAKAGHKTKADEILIRALDEVRSVRSPYSQASVMADIARRYLELDQYDIALEVAVSMRDDYNKPRSFAEIAAAFGEKGDKEKAAGIFVQALQAASTVEDNFYKSWALAEIAVKYSEAEMIPDAAAKDVLKKIVRDTIDVSGQNAGT